MVSPPPIMLVLVPTVLLTLHRTHTFEVTMNMMTMTMTITIAMLMTMMTMTNRVKIVRPKKQLLDCVSSSLDQLVQGVRCAANLANKMRMIMAMMASSAHPVDKWGPSGCHSPLNQLGALGS